MPIPKRLETSIQRRGGRSMCCAERAAGSPAGLITVCTILLLSFFRLYCYLIDSSNVRFKCVRFCVTYSTGGRPHWLRHSGHKLFLKKSVTLLPTHFLSPTVRLMLLPALLKHFSKAKFPILFNDAVTQSVVDE